MTSFYLILSQHLLDTDFFKQVLQVGFLAQFTSLLSCNGMLDECYNDELLSVKYYCLGDEQGMLEDMVVVVQELRSVSFQVYTCVTVKAKNANKNAKKKFLPGIEPGTLRV